MYFEITGNRKIFLEPGQLYMLGKQFNEDEKKSKNLIPLQEEEDVNQRHCVIETNYSGEAFVFDLNSFKGTLLNDVELISLEKTRLKNGDVIKIGKQELKYFQDLCLPSQDSSGFLEVNKNTSDISLSLDSTLPVEYCLKGINNKFLESSIPDKNPTTPIKPAAKIEDELNSSKSAVHVSNTLLKDRRSDSFTIPATQYCRAQNSLNSSDVSVPESLHDANASKIKINFGNLESFVDDADDDVCIPETQELMPDVVVPINCTTELLSDIQNKVKKKSFFAEESSKSEREHNLECSQFRIITQDYNEGFGEEESVNGLHSQIIPLIKHQMVCLNNINTSATKDLENQSNKERMVEDNSAPRRSNKSSDQDFTDLRDCLTPDIFEFEENVKPGIVLDEEDYLITQVFPTSTVKDNTVLRDPEQLCLEKENEEILTSSDKENACPIAHTKTSELSPTQPIKATSQTAKFACKIVNAIEPNTPSNYDPDEEDDLLTQAFLLPSSSVNTSSSASNKKVPNQCFNSTHLDDKVAQKPPANLFDEMEKTSEKEASSSVTAFKKPEVVLKRTSATLETDLDLLMCTPKFIKENIFVGKSEDLKKNILAAKNKDLFGDESEEEDDDDQSDLVKLINVPRDSFDFDKLLPHLNNRRPQRSRMSAEKKASKEEQKIYQFNIAFGKEQDDKATFAKSPTLSRDKRHAARDKKKESTERKKQKTTEKERSHSRDNFKAVSGSAARKSSPKRKPSAGNGRVRNQKKPEIAETTSSPNKKEHLAKSCSSEETRKSKQYVSEEKNKEGSTKRRKLSNSQEKLLANHSAVSCSSESLQFIKENTQSIEKEPVRRVTRSNSACKQHESQRSVIPDRSSKKQVANKNDRKDKDKDTTTKKPTERKRESNAQVVGVPAKVERKILTKTQFQVAPSISIIISASMVDKELLKRLEENSKHIWIIGRNPAESEILVMDKACRTFKFLLAMARGIPIVTSEYLKKLNEQPTKGVRVIDYSLVDEAFEKAYDFSLVKSLHAAKTQKLFEGYEFLMTKSILPNPNEIKALIEASGGYIHEKTPPNTKENQKLYLVTTEEDRKEWHKYRRLNKNIIIVSTEAIMSVIMRQNCERMAHYILT